jgi:16S rRNA processing protein RimM
MVDESNHESRITSHHILIGEIVAAQSIKGQVRINAYTENPASLANYSAIVDQHGNAISLKIASTKNKQAFASVKGCVTRNDAEKLVGTKLFVARDALPKPADGEVYFSDLVGLEVRNATKKIATIKAMYDFGAGTIMEIVFAINGKTEMLPYNKKVVKETDIVGGYIVIDMPDIILAQE